MTNDKGVRVLVEVKHYSGSVPTKEVDKFLRDVELESNAVSGGLFVAVEGFIAKKS